jgi:hypothetical protein
VDTRTRKIGGGIIVVVGLVIAVVGAFADSFGLGGEGTEFGAKQIAMLVVGLVVAALGLVVAFVLKGDEQATT